MFSARAQLLFKLCARASLNVCVLGGVVLLDGAASVSGHGAELVKRSGGKGHGDRQPAGEH